MNGASDLTWNQQALAAVFDLHDRVNLLEEENRLLREQIEASQATSSDPRPEPSHADPRISHAADLALVELQDRLRARIKSVEVQIGEQTQDIADALVGMLATFGQDQAALLHLFVEESRRLVQSVTTEADRETHEAITKARQLIEALTNRIGVPETLDLRPLVPALPQASQYPVVPESGRESGLPSVVSDSVPCVEGSPLSWSRATPSTGTSLGDDLGARGPAVTVEARRGRGPVIARIIVSPFPSFTALIKFETDLKRLEGVRRFRSRAFRAGRYEVALEHDPNVSVIDAVLHMPDHHIELIQVDGDRFFFRLLGSDATAAVRSEQRD